MISWLRTIGGEAASALIAAAEANATAISQAHARAVADTWTARFVPPLLQLGLEPSREDGPPCCGENALHVASLYGNTAAIETLLAGDASLLESRSRAGLTSLSIAMARGRREAACVLWARMKAAGMRDDAAHEMAVPTEHRWMLDTCERVDDGHAHEQLGTPQPPLSSPPPPPDAAWGVGSLPAAMQSVIDQPCGSNSAGLVTTLDTIEPESFFREYYYVGRPLLLRGAASSWPMRAAWTRQKLRSELGHLRFVPASVPYARSFAMAAGEATSLRRFVSGIFDADKGTEQHKANNESSAPLYIFERAIEKGDGRAALPARPLPLTMPQGKVLAAARLPRMPPPLDMPVPVRPQPAQFYLGAAGSGAPLHYHGDAYNVLAHGRKRWYLFPPDAANYSIVPASVWAAQTLPDLCKRCEQGRAPPWKCPLTLTQEAGDILFVPRDWAHAVVNLQPSVGYAVEFDSPYSRSST